MGGYMPAPTTERRPFSEKKFGEETLGIWEKPPLPEAAVAPPVPLIPSRGERAVLSWRAGRLGLPDGEVTKGEPVDAAVKRIALEQAGILEPTATWLGQFRCRATIYSTEPPPGTITYRALYGVDVGSLAGFPGGGSSW